MIKNIITQNLTTKSWLYSNIVAKVAIRLRVKKAICAKSVYKVLKAKKYKSCKQTTKLGLTKETKDAC